MGWSSGTELVEEIATAIKAYVGDADIKRKLYDALVSAAITQDWDNEDEVKGMDPILDEAIDAANDFLNNG